MSDYIKREDALDIVADNNVHGEITLNRYDKIIDGIYEIPPADVVPVVRCKDCKWWDYSEDEYSICCAPPRNVYDVAKDGSDFCSLGERKDNEKVVR